MSAGYRTSAQAALRAAAGAMCLSLLPLYAAWPAEADAAPGVGRAIVPLATGVSITVPASANIGSTTPGRTISGHLGSVTAVGTGVSTWTATVSATNFRTGTGTPALTITTSMVAYWSGLYTAKSGSGTFTAGQPTAADAQTLDTPRLGYKRQGSAMNTSATWNPTLVVTVPATAVAGVYTGTVTHSIA